MQSIRWFLLTIVLAVLVLACGDSGDSGDDSTVPIAEATSSSTGIESSSTIANQEPETGFAAEVLPILENACAGCHVGNGPGTPHLRLDTVADAIESSVFIVEAVELGTMPPWPASNLSVAFRDDWSITAEERETLIAWARRPLTDIDSATPIVRAGGIQALSDVDVELAPQVGYQGVAGQPDEYRCFILDPEFEQDTWLAGYEFVPDQTEVVHHAIGYLVSRSLRGRADQLNADNADNGGWPCFGSSGLGEDELFLGWAPGQGPTELPAGSAMRVGANEFLVIQVHYHFEDDAEIDFSTLRLDLVEGDASSLDPVEVISFLAPAEIPCTSSESGPLCDRSAAIAAAESKYGPDGVNADFALLLCRASVEDFATMTNGVASSSCDLPMRADGQLISVLGHEHELGTSFRMTLNPGTADELLLLDIPEWDFDWQLNYYPSDNIEVTESDTIRIECSWDRSLRDPDLEPAYVVWADGTNDEMCFATVLLREQ